VHDFQEHLDGLGLFHMELSLERIGACLRALGLERPPFPVVQVVGTNGKGSIARCLAALARHHRLRAGLYTSPHFLSPTERIRIDGRELEEEAWLASANAVRRAAPELTYFELLTAMAVHAFASAGVGLAVLEAGLGGTWDATSAVAADLVVLSRIGMDHQHVLGHDLAAIAADKAGAMRRPISGGGCVAVAGPQYPAAAEALRARATSVGCELAEVSTPQSGFLDYRDENRTVAAAAWRRLSRIMDIPPAPDQFEPEVVLQRVEWPGRLQQVAAKTGLHPALVLDAGHNAQALAALGAALLANGIRPVALIFTCLRDKDLAAMAPLAVALTTGPILVPGLPGVERARDPAEVVAALGTGARPVADLREALRASLELASEGTVLLCGSLYLLAEFFTVRPDCLPPADQAGWR
jgi:dihydrofolate synthase/folylpolyglutamate synthase